MPKPPLTADPYPIGRLFAVATIHAEDVLDAAVAGQNPHLDRHGQLAALGRLKRALARTERVCRMIAKALEKPMS